MKIKRMSISLSEKGLSEKILELDCKETTSCYVVDNESSFGGKTTRIKQGNILKVESMVRDNLYYILQFYTWYFETDEDRARKLLMDQIVKVACHQADIASKMVKNLNK